MTIDQTIVYNSLILCAIWFYAIHRLCILLNGLKRYCCQSINIEDVKRLATDFSFSSIIITIIITFFCILNIELLSLSVARRFFSIFRPYSQLIKWLTKSKLFPFQLMASNMRTKRREQLSIKHNKQSQCHHLIR